MWIIDLTTQLTLNRQNYYCFNPSLIHFRDDIYIMVYRIAKYDLPIILLPWRVWDNGYKYFSNPAQVIQNKYRYEFGDRLTITIPISNEDMILPTAEFDSTGLAFFSFDGTKFTLIHNINAIFGSEMNQDARIIKIGSEFYISYNIFEKTDKIRVCMRYRKMQINDGKIHLSKEHNMFIHKYKSIEKNCVFDSSGNILYEIGRTFKIIINTVMIQTPVPELVKLIDHYGDNNIYISIGCPPIPYGINMLAMGHIKILYKKLCTKFPVNQFLHTIDFARIHKHGKYIYFMFFYVYDHNYNIIKLSNPFIPSFNMNHLPYLLVFPAGLCMINNKICISYGEGDCKTKLLVLTDTELNNLLIDKLTMGFYFLSNTNTIQHYGYFGHYNCGDDAFVLVFKYLQRKFYPHFNLDFTNKYKPGYLLTVVGGGDVINKYFLEGIESNSSRTIIGAGVGIPYVSEEHYISLFTHTILRNPRDTISLKNKYNNVSYCPDLAFLLSRIIPMEHLHPTGKKIGMCLVRTYYKPLYEHIYTKFVVEIVKFISMMIADKYTIHLIPFCINKKKPNENDLLLLIDIKQYFPTGQVCIEYDESYTNETYVVKIYKKIAEMDFNICSRFHSHIFSTIHKIPFVSLTCGRKCIEYMRDIELTNNLYQLKTNEVDLPIEFDGTHFYRFVKNKITNSFNIKKKLAHFMNIYETLMDSFEKKWTEIIFKSLVNSKDTKLYPDISNSELFPMTDLDFCNSPPIMTDRGIDFSPKDVPESKSTNRKLDFNPDTSDPKFDPNHNLDYNLPPTSTSSRESSSNMSSTENSISNHQTYLNIHTKSQINSAGIESNKLNNKQILTRYELVPIQYELVPIHCKSASIIQNPVRYEIQYQPVRYESRPIQYQSVPIQYESRPIQYQPVQYKSRPIQYQPIQYQPVQYESRPVSYQPIHYEQIQYESVPIQYEQFNYHTDHESNIVYCDLSSNSNTKSTYITNDESDPNDHDRNSRNLSCSGPLPTSPKID